ncbi:MAG: hypothetical protein MUO63_08945 [Desulfobulbaceae bacterium]|nr:hypothetical protein [Desulfobulbaceae bacterium]
MEDWYKRQFEISNAASQAFEQFKRFDNLYGKSLARIVKDIKAQDDLIKSSMSPFISSYADIIASLQPEIDRVRELYSSKSIIDSITQANSCLATLFSEQTSISRLIEESASVNRLWKSEIDSIKQLSSSAEASKLAIGLHYEGIAKATLLAQERLLKSPWNDLEKSVFHKTGELYGALNSFKSLSENYNLFVHSFSEKQFNITDFPPFVSGLPPVEILISSDLIDTISRIEDEEYVEEADNLEDGIRENIEISLEELLVHVNPEIKRLWLGAKGALSSTNPDKKRHVVVSLREMITHILHGIAPDLEVKKWTTDPSHYYEGRPTRKARLLFVCRDINHGPFKEFVNKDVESHIKFIDLFQRGTHEININFTDQQIRTLIVRSEALARFLLTTWKNTM